MSQESIVDRMKSKSSHARGSRSVGSKIEGSGNGRLTSATECDSLAVRNRHRRTPSTGASRHNYRIAARSGINSDLDVGGRTRSSADSGPMRTSSVKKKAEQDKGKYEPAFAFHFTSQMPNPMRQAGALTATQSSRTGAVSQRILHS